MLFSVADHGLVNCWLLGPEDLGMADTLVVLVTVQLLLSFLFVLDRSVDLFHQGKLVLVKLVEVFTDFRAFRRRNVL